jgi:hypothetical protein
LSDGARVLLALGPADGRLEMTWELDALRSLSEQSVAERAPWALVAGSGESGQSPLLLRVVSAALDDGTAIGLAALRARSAAGHGEEEVAAFVVPPEGDPVDIPEALISTEYDAEGRVRRAGLELWIREAGPPARAAGDRHSATPVRRGGLAGESVRMGFRLDGVPGTAVYELLRPVG